MAHGITLRARSRAIEQHIQAARAATAGATLTQPEAMALCAELARLRAEVLDAVGLRARAINVVEALV